MILSKSYQNTRALYHTSLHGVDVCYSTYLILTFLKDNDNKIKNISDLDIVSLVFSALCHDVGHPGLTNKFLINSKDEISIIYNDISVLENFHSAKTFQLLENNDLNIFSNLSKEDFSSLRKKIIEEILATDMSFHYKIVDEFKEYSKNFDIKMIQNELSFITHISDLSHNYRRFEVSLKWVDLLSNEFWNQGDKEKELGLPVSFLCDRNDIDVPKSQISFINTFSLPTIELLVEINTNFNYMKNNASDNLNKWKKLESENRKRGWTPEKNEKSPEDAVLILDHVSVTYKDGGTETKALTDVSLQVNKGDFIGIIGHTGSGKSTMIQTFNGLIAPTEGHIYFNGKDISDSDFDKQKLRTSVGMVFQYPEHQLFETTVLEDVKFGPKNQGLDDKEAALRAYEALKKVHFPEDSFDASPFELSGGQKRRAAIAGVIAMRPEVIILDEPTAGLDPAGRDEILGLIKEMHDKSGETVILVSHSMEDVAEYVDRTVVIDKGRPVYDGTPREVFSHVKELESMGLAVPSVTYLLHDLHSQGYPVDDHAVTVEEAGMEIMRVFQ